MRRLLPVALALGLSTGGFAAVLGAGPASAAPVTVVTFVGATQAAHATTNWSVAFTTSSGGSLGNGNTISVTFPAGFALPPSPTVSLGSGFSACTATGSTSGQVVTVHLTGIGCTVHASTAVSLAIDGITNPAAGMYSGASVSTTKDSAGSPASPIVISAAPSGVSFTGSSQASNATNTNWTVTFTTSSTGTLGAGSTITITFAPGFLIPSNPTVVLGSGFTACTASATASGDVVTVHLSGGGCSVHANTTATLTIEGITNPGAGSYPASEFSVATSADPGPVSPANPVVIGVAPNGSGTMVVSPLSVFAGSTNDTLVFTYTAAAGGMSGGVLDLSVPAGWSVPSTTGTAPGYTTSTCGVVSIVTVTTIQVTGVNLAGGASCTITYGSKAAGGIGASAPLTSQVSTFVAGQASTSSVAVATLATSPQVTVGGGASSLTELFGSDDIGTAIAVSEAEFPSADSAGGVVLARDDFFSDALAGGPLAAWTNGPLLITPGAPISAGLDPRVASEIQRVLAPGGTVYVLGGPLALSPNIDGQLAGLGYHVVRLGGADEYDTAVEIAQQMGSPSTIFEATGVSFYDALSAVPAAIKLHAAILLTNGATQSYATGLYIVGHPGVTRYAVGGPDQAFGADPGASPIYGQTLFGTSAAVANVFFPGASLFGIATAASFQDALGGGVFMATDGRSGPLLLVNPTTPLPSEIAGYLASLAIGTPGYVFGGPLAVGGDVLTAVQEAVG